MTDSLFVPNFKSRKNSPVPAIKPKAKYVFFFLIYTRLYTFASVTETCEHLASHNAEKLTTLASVFLEGLRMTD